MFNLFPIGCVALIVAACTPTGLGLTGQVKVLPDAPNGCIRSAELTRWYDLTVAALLGEMENQRYQHVERVAAAMRARPMYLCRRKAPQPCCGSGACAGPCKAGAKWTYAGGTVRSLPMCARKRGCADSFAIWIAEDWPPKCDPRWTAEPHCLPPAKWQASKRHWLLDFAHEVANALWLRAGNYDPSYRGRFYGHGGPDRKAQALIGYMLGIR